MFNPNAPADLLKSGEELLVEYINMANETNYTVNEVTFATPRPSADSAYNTDIEITIATPIPGQAEPVDITGEFHYPRFDLQRLFEGRSLVLKQKNETTTTDLIAAILSEARVQFDATDLVEEDLPTTGSYPRAVVLRAAPGSLRFIGQFSVDLVDTKPVDASIITAGSVSPNMTPSASTLKSDGTLRVGTGRLAEKMFVATNGELEMFSSARYEHTNFAIASREDKVILDVGEHDDWTIPYSFALRDKRNGPVLTDRYDLSLKIQSVSTNAKLDFAVKRLYGRLRLIDVDNGLDVYNEEAVNADQSLLQDQLRVAWYKGKLGVLPRNEAGALLGDYTVTLTAVDVEDADNTLEISYTVEVRGIAL